MTDFIHIEQKIFSRSSCLQLGKAENSWKLSLSAGRSSRRESKSFRSFSSCEMALLLFCLSGNSADPHGYCVIFFTSVESRQNKVKRKKVGFFAKLLWKLGIVFLKINKEYFFSSGLCGKETTLPKYWGKDGFLFYPCPLFTIFILVWRLSWIW